MIKDYYISEEDFIDSVIATEKGLIGLIAKDYILRVYKGRNRLFLPYRFNFSFSASTFEFEDGCTIVRDKIDAWYEANKDTMNENTELPLFCINNTFSNFYGSRLGKFIDSSVDPNEEWFQKYKNEEGIINSDHNAVYPYTKDTIISADDFDRIYIINPNEKSAYLGDADLLDVVVNGKDISSMDKFLGSNNCVDIVSQIIQSRLKEKHDIIEIFEGIDY